MDRQIKAYCFGLTTVLLWSTVASAFKLSLNYLSPVELLFYAAIFSIIALSIIVFVQGKGKLVVQCRFSAWKRGILLGFLNPFLYYLVLIKAYDLLPAQQAQPLNYTWAITLTLLSVPILGHKLTKKDFIAIIISYIGVYIISTKGDVLSVSFENSQGVILALGSTLIWAIYWLMNTRDTRDPVIGLLLNFLCGLPIITGYLFVTEGFRLVPAAGLAGAAYVGFFEMGISYVLWLLALKNSRSTARVANLIFLSPFLSLILIHFFVGEHIMAGSIVGLVFIVAGLAVQNINIKPL